MSIDEAMTNLESLQKDYQDFHDEVWKDPETYSINAESLKKAIETMRKYQKIEQIYKDYCFPTKFVNTFDAMEMIGEVLKDGSD